MTNKKLIEMTESLIGCSSERAMDLVGELRRFELKLERRNIDKCERFGSYDFLPKVERTKQHQHIQHIARFTKKHKSVFDCKAFQQVDPFEVIRARYGKEVTT